MSAAHLELPEGRTAGLSTARAMLPGIGIAVALWGVAWVAGVLTPESVGPAALGVGLAGASAWAGAVLHRRMATQRDQAGALVAGAGVTRALALGFILKLLAFGAGAVVVVLGGLKFPQVAAFAIAFAAAAMVCQGAAALGLVRQMSAAAQGPRGGACPDTGGRTSCSPDDQR